MDGERDVCVGRQEVSRRLIHHHLQHHRLWFAHLLRSICDIEGHDVIDPVHFWVSVD